MLDSANANGNANLSHQVGRAAERADAKERARSLVSRLEHAIADSADRREVMLKAADHVLVVEPHRDHHAYHLGARTCSIAGSQAAMPQPSWA